jgi:S-adenosylmethionine:tRNA-ribosyltransferase-isomerase (queuine synthetase)
MKRAQTNTKPPPRRLEHAVGGAHNLPSAVDSLEAVLDWGGAGGAEGHTQLMIVPGYRFAFCDQLFTNTHQPRCGPFPYPKP